MRFSSSLTGADCAAFCRFRSSNASCAGDLSSSWKQATVEEMSTRSRLKNIKSRLSRRVVGEQLLTNAQKREEKATHSQAQIEQWRIDAEESQLKIRTMDEVSEDA